MKRSVPSTKKGRLPGAAGIAALAISVSCLPGSAWGQVAPSKPEPSKTKKPKLGPFDVTINWRFRTEAWDFFQSPSGQDAYAFEHSGRASGGARSLANVWDVSLDLPLRYGSSITTYYAHTWAKSVIANIFPAGTNAQFVYVETNFRF